MSRGPDGRFVTDTGLRNRYHDPVPVTCASCGHATAGEIYLKNSGYVGDPIETYCASCRVPRGQTYGIIYDRTPDHSETCHWCARSFHCDSPIRRYCTELCRQRGAMAKRDQRRRRKLEWRFRCEICGESFAAPRSDASYCSPVCRQRAYRKRQVDAAAKRAYDAEMLHSYEARLYS